MNRFEATFRLGSTTSEGSDMNKITIVIHYDPDKTDVQKIMDTLADVEEINAPGMLNFDYVDEKVKDPQEIADILKGREKIS